MLSLKLAANNIKKGFKSFAPFLMASVTMFVMLFVTASIALSPSIHKLRGGSSLSQIMSFAGAIGDNPNTVGKDPNIWNLAYMTIKLSIANI